MCEFDPSQVVTSHKDYTEVGNLYTWYVNSER
jgi:hypothetical protein